MIFDYWDEVSSHYVPLTDLFEDISSLRMIAPQEPLYILQIIWKIQRGSNLRAANEKKLGFKKEPVNT